MISFSLRSRTLVPGRRFPAASIALCAFLLCFLVVSSSSALTLMDSEQNYVAPTKADAAETTKAPPSPAKTSGRAVSEEKHVAYGDPQFYRRETW